MIAIRPTNVLLVAVGLVIFANQVFAHSTLKQRRGAYAVLQGLNLLFILVVAGLPLTDLAGSVRAIVRVFLCLFGLWHMVQSWQQRAAIEREAEFLRRRADLQALGEDFARQKDETPPSS